MYLAQLFAVCFSLTLIAMALGQSASNLPQLSVFDFFGNQSNPAVISSANLTDLNAISPNNGPNAVSTGAVNDTINNADRAMATTPEPKNPVSAGGKDSKDVDVIIAAPVAEPGKNKSNGIYVSPDSKSVSIAIGGAEIAFLLNKKTNDSGPINGENLPEALKGSLPDFLKIADDKARKGFFEIETNGNIPKGQYLKAIMIWADQQNDAVKTAFDDYLIRVKEQNALARQHIDAKAGNLSQKAQTANKQIQAIVDDETISKNEEAKQISAIFDALPKRLQKELTSLTDETK